LSNGEGFEQTREKRTGQSALPAVSNTGKAVMRAVLAGGFVAAILTLLLLSSLSDGTAKGSSNEIRFEDMAASAGIGARIVCGTAEKKWTPEANGTGCGWLDYDNDGWMDLLVVNGSTIERLKE